MRFSLAALALLLSLSASGAQKHPPFPEPGEDAKFEPTEHLENADCQIRLEAAVRVPEPGHTGIWYASDGSCRLKGGAAAVARAAERIADSLRHARRYRDFPDLLDFAPIGDDGELRRDEDDVAKLPVFIAVKGPEFAGIASAATYVVKNTVSTRNETIDGNEVRAWIVRFSETRAPRLFRIPDLPGITVPALQIQKIPAVDGFWYVNTRGIVRYRTQADFGPAMKLVENTDFPRRVLFGTLTHVLKGAEE